MRERRPRPKSPESRLLSTSVRTEERSQRPTIHWLSHPTPFAQAIRSGRMVLVSERSPPLETGDLIPTDTIYNTGPVMLTVGRREARVLYSLASPGYAGLDQVLFEVPSGVSGNVPVQANMGTIRLNSVMIPVR